ncbi:unnamed protein product [Prorocentrum cordatum]|uniref:Uncharacterized protein n=1 Tax=Prorocentrum cordatum TaxID=2364126 RepID=A0ABN9TYP5_9DINO|nr:unnamed protein product [Polarella glacialis]
MKRPKSAIPRPSTENSPTRPRNSATKGLDSAPTRTAKPSTHCNSAAAKCEGRLTSTGASICISTKTTRTNSTRPKGVSSSLATEKWATLRTAGGTSARVHDNGPSDAESTQASSMRNARGPERNGHLAAGVMACKQQAPRAVCRVALSSPERGGAGGALPPAGAQGTTPVPLERLRPAFPAGHPRTSAGDRRARPSASAVSGSTSALWDSSVVLLEPHER